MKKILLVLLIIFLVFPNMLFAQKYERSTEIEPKPITRAEIDSAPTIRLVSGNFSFLFYVGTKQTKEIVESHKSIFRSEEIKNGVYAELDTMGFVKTFGSYKRNLKNGIWMVKDSIKNTHYEFWRKGKFIKNINIK